MEPSGWTARHAFCHALPKCELHAHMNGCIRNSTILDLAKELESRGQKTLLNEEDLELLTADSADRSLAQCFRLFAIIHRVTTTHNAVTRIAREVTEDFFADNVRYLELRTTPKDNPKEGMTKESYMDAVLAGLKSFHDAEDTFFQHRSSHSGSSLEKGEADDSDCNATLQQLENGATSGRAASSNVRDAVTESPPPPIIVRLLLSIDRRESTEDAMATVRLAAALTHRGIVGIDLSGNPCVGSWASVLPALQLARSLSLPITLHCAEVANDAEADAMLAFGPERLGHVCCLSEKQWGRLRGLGIPLELCLTSNVKTESVRDYTNHHFSEVYKGRHPVALCTDDTGVFSTTLSREYALAATALGLSDAEVKRLCTEAFRFSFVDGQVREYLLGSYGRLE